MIQKKQKTKQAFLKMPNNVEMKSEI